MKNPLTTFCAMLDRSLSTREMNVLPGVGSPARRSIKPARPPSVVRLAPNCEPSKVKRPRDPGGVVRIVVQHVEAELHGVRTARQVNIVGHLISSGHASSDAILQAQVGE